MQQASEVLTTSFNIFPGLLKNPFIFKYFYKFNIKKINHIKSIHNKKTILFNEYIIRFFKFIL